MLVCCVVFVFFFKQKTAYEMRISDWSSDVCSSDLAQRLLGDEAVGTDRTRVDLIVDEVMELQHIDVAHGHLAIELVAGAAVVEVRLARFKIGRGSCRARVCKYV